jgi:hypothetical protein
VPRFLLLLVTRLDRARQRTRVFPSLLLAQPQLLEITLAMILVILLPAGMAEARLVITPITLHKDERAGSFARLEVFLKGNINIG